MEPWFIQGQQVGTYQSARNLTYARIWNGSHMVAVDNNRETYDMINRWLGVEYVEPFDSYVGQVRIPFHRGLCVSRSLSLRP